MTPEIPQITDPLGRYWEQPSRDGILVDDKHALMDYRTFEKLLDYSSSQPTGVYPGKMWRSRRRDGWVLCWYGDVTEDGKVCWTFTRPVLFC